MINIYSKPYNILTLLEFKVINIYINNSFSDKKFDQNLLKSIIKILVYANKDGKKINLDPNDH